MSRDLGDIKEAQQRPDFLHHPLIVRLCPCLSVAERIGVESYPAPDRRVSHPCVALKMAGSAPKLLSGSSGGGRVKVDLSGLSIRLMIEVIPALKEQDSMIERSWLYKGSLLNIIDSTDLSLPHLTALYLIDRAALNLPSRERIRDGAEGGTDRQGGERRNIYRL